MKDQFIDYLENVVGMKDPTIIEKHDCLYCGIYMVDKGGNVWLDGQVLGSLNSLLSEE